MLKTREVVVSVGWSGWIWEDPDGDGEWVAAADTEWMGHPLGFRVLSQIRLGVLYIWKEGSLG